MALDFAEHVIDIEQEPDEKRRSPLMSTGLLWYDNSDTPIAEKIARAAAFHLKKYGVVPNICMVHPAVVELDALEIKGANGSKITIRPLRSVPSGHLWIGVEEMPTGEKK